MAKQQIDPALVAAYLQRDLSTQEKLSLELIIPALLDSVYMHCGIRWDATAETDSTEYFDGGTSMILPKYAVDTITSLSIDDMAQTEAENYWNYTTYIRFDGPVICDHRGIKLVYQGVTTLPSDVKLAVIEWAAGRLSLKDTSGKEVRRFSLGAYSVEYANTSTAIPDFVKSVLDRHVRSPGI